eukprot:2712744-Pleurochrysis_carterae.AAC.1
MCFLRVPSLACNQSSESVADAVGRHATAYTATSQQAASIDEHNNKVTVLNDCVLKMPSHLAIYQTHSRSFRQTINVSFWLTTITPPKNARYVEQRRRTDGMVTNNHKERTHFIMRYDGRYLIEVRGLMNPT